MKTETIAVCYAIMFSFLLIHALTVTVPRLHKAEAELSQYRQANCIAPAGWPIPPAQ